MSDKRKLGPIRQLSLQTDIRTRPILKKQHSVEHLESVDENRSSGRRIESAKNKLSDRPRPIRLAWAETRQNSRDETTPVEVKKCKEYKRPTTAKLRAQPTIEKDSILYTRQELAERLRKAWKDREESKQNLDIFLTHNIQEENEKAYADYNVVIQSKTVSNTETLNNIHNKTTQKQKPKLPESNYIPSTTASKPQEVRTNLYVTIPSVAQNYKQIQQFDTAEIISLAKQVDVEPEPVKIEPEKEPKLMKQASITKEPENICKNLPTRPLTAASKRDGFQKRTNTAFNGSLSVHKDFRPPLSRTLSVPVKNDKPKFIAAKRRLKPTRRKDRDEEYSGDEAEETDKNGGKKGLRCKSAPGGGGELVTMVSLVSPAGSDTEEVLEKKQETKSRSSSPVKAANGTNAEPPKTLTLRKTVKQVSFQQSSIHTVRSFSASFPARRGSMAAALNNAIANIHQALPEREKRAPGDGSPGDARGPKRKLVRNASTPQTNSIDIEDSQTQESPNVVTKEPSTVPTTTSNHTNSENNSVATHTSQAAKEKSKTKETHEQTNEETKLKEDEAIDEPGAPKFTTTKEKECWAMYKKMSDKGLPVSFDTILRGMLTPTEYRSIKKEVATN